MHTVKINGIKLIYTNTYNAYLKICQNFISKNIEENNRLINQMSSNAYVYGKRIPLSTYPNRVTEEVVLHDSKVFCFIVIDSPDGLSSYRVLYNYLLQSDLGIDSNISSITDVQRSSIHYVPEQFRVNNHPLLLKKPNEPSQNLAVINTYESFLDYTFINGLPRHSDSNKPFCNDFLHHIKSTSIRLNHLDDQYGSKSINPISSRQFTYFCFENIIIITSYKILIPKTPSVSQMAKPLVCPF